jgi:hypothetical protein
MSLLGNFNNRPPRPIGWNPDRSTDRFAYRIYSVRPDTSGLRTGLWLASAAGVALLAFLIYLKLNAATPAQTGTEEAAVPTATFPPLIIEPVQSGESWGVVAVSEAMVYALPGTYGFPTQKLARWTLLAFEQKSSNGWYRLYGGSGWIPLLQVRTYPDEKTARAAITQGRNQNQNYLPPPKGK